MTKLPVAEHESADLLKIAADILGRRKLRPQYFDHQFFGEQSWELLLHLFVVPTGVTSLNQVATSLAMSSPTVMAISRLLASQGLAIQGDSSGGWDEMPLSLTEKARLKLRDYLAALINSRLAA